VLVRRLSIRAALRRIAQVRLLDKVGSRRIKLVIDQRLHLFDKLNGVWLVDMMTERGLIQPARVNIEQPCIPD
jgi:hypothetical protein